jgi:hypothetical protein
VATYRYVDEKIDGNTLAEWNRRRWAEDDVEALPQGFTLKRRGREGSLYYRESDRILELNFEISGTPEQDILVSVAGFEKWILPATEDVAPEAQSSIRRAAEDWLEQHSTRAMFW